MKAWADKATQKLCVDGVIWSVIIDDTFTTKRWNVGSTAERKIRMTSLLWNATIKELPEPWEINKYTTPVSLLPTPRINGDTRRRKKRVRRKIEKLDAVLYGPKVRCIAEIMSHDVDDWFLKNAQGVWRW